MPEHYPTTVGLQWTTAGQPPSMMRWYIKHNLHSMSCVRSVCLAGQRSSRFSSAFQVITMRHHARSLQSSAFAVYNHDVDYSGVDDMVFSASPICERNACRMRDRSGQHAKCEQRVLPTEPAGEARARLVD